MSVHGCFAFMKNAPFSFSQAAFGSFSDHGDHLHESRRFYSREILSERLLIASFDDGFADCIFAFLNCLFQGKRRYRIADSNFKIFVCHSNSSILD